jgi:hypothetical protein
VRHSPATCGHGATRRENGQDQRDRQDSPSHPVDTVDPVDKTRAWRGVIRMQYGSIEGVGKPVSRIIQGGMMLTKSDDNPEWPFDLLDGVVAQPMNVFALVAAYSEEEAGRNTAALDIHLGRDELAWLDLERDRGGS